MPSAELGDELGVEPGLVDPQVRVGEQAVPVEPLDVVALEGRPVAPDLHLVGVHGPHEQGAGDRPAEGRGVEVGPAPGADVERPARDGGQALLHERVPAVDEPRELGAVLPGAVGDRVDLGLVVLAEVGRVRAGDRALLPHPRDGDGGVETSGEGDADAFADGQGGQDLGHDARLYRSLHTHQLPSNAGVRHDARRMPHAGMPHAGRRMPGCRMPGRPLGADPAGRRVGGLSRRRGGRRPAAPST